MGKRSEELLFNVVVTAESCLRQCTMANVARSPGSTNQDVGSIWQTAIDQYEAITTIKLHSLARANSVEEILSEIREEDSTFKTFRHDGSRVDKFRSLVSRSLRPIQVLSEITAEAASSVS